MVVSPARTSGSADLWTVDEQSLASFARAIGSGPSDHAWCELRRQAESIALVPGFDRLITG